MDYGNDDDEGGSSFPQDDTPKGRKRSVKNREMHNMLEKNRRAHLKTCFDSLRDAVPGSDESKQSTVSIIQNASTFIGVCVGFEGQRT